MRVDGSLCIIAPSALRLVYSTCYLCTQVNTPPKKYAVAQCSELIRENAEH